LGMPLREALPFVKQILGELGLSNEIRILAAGKIITGFDILKTLSLGAAACYTARGMMFAIGCIQALICDSGKCPVGVATQNPALYKGLDPTDKAVRVFNFHLNTIQATREMMEACGFPDTKSINPSKFFRRTEDQTTKSFEEIYFKRKKERMEQNKIKSLLN